MNKWCKSIKPPDHRSVKQSWGKKNPKQSMPHLGGGAQTHNPASLSDI